MNNEKPLSFILFLGVTAAVCGALVMVVEVLGSRVIGPFFGVSLFVWTGLITVTLVALSVGYAMGGILSDKKNTPDYLYGIVFLSGVLVMLIPVLRKPVLMTFQSYGLRMGSFLSSAVLFGPSLMLLGCISPYVVRLAAKEVRNLGRLVGIFYSISTMGSFIGTIMTGYVLIAYFDVYKIFLTTGLLLVLISCVYLVFFRKKVASAAALVLLMAAAWQYQEPLVDKVLQSGTRVTEIYRKETFYGAIKVVDYSFGTQHTRELMLDGQIQGGIDLNSNESVYEFAYFLELLPYLTHPEGKSCLVIGLGAGIVPLWYEKNGIRTDVVEINPEVVRVARDFFKFGVSGNVYVQDARYFLENTENSYDFMILDVFNGDTTPAHLLSREAVHALKEHLNPKGILAINLIGSLGGENYMTASVVKTLQSSFQHVKIYPLFSPDENEGVGNIAILAHDASFAGISPDRLRSFTIHPMVSERVVKYFGREFRFPAKTAAVMLTDRYNPIDFYDAQLKEKTRKDILKFTDQEILL